MSGCIEHTFMRERKRIEMQKGGKGQYAHMHQSAGHRSERITWEREKKISCEKRNHSE